MGYTRLDHFPQYSSGVGPMVKHHANVNFHTINLGSEAGPEVKQVSEVGSDVWQPSGRWVVGGRAVVG